MFSIGTLLCAKAAAAANAIRVHSRLGFGRQHNAGRNNGESMDACMMFSKRLRGNEVFKVVRDALAEQMPPPESNEGMEEDDDPEKYG